MKFLAPLALLLTLASAAPVANPEMTIPAKELRTRQNCYTVWNYLNCSSNGPTSQTGTYTVNAGTPSSCTAICNGNAANQFAGIWNGSVCICGAANANSMPQSEAGSCNSSCQGSSRNCSNGSCRCGGPRAYSVYQKGVVCF